MKEEDKKIILTDKVSIDFVKEFAKSEYITMIKGCVDIKKELVAIGGHYHMETCELLSTQGSNHLDVWGFNIRFEIDENGELEFDSLVNIKPALKNMSRSINDQNVIDKATIIIKNYIDLK